MWKNLSTKQKINIASSLLFFVGLAILIIIDNWWPTIMLVTGIPLALRQYLLKRNYDAAMTLFVFLGTFTSVAFNIAWRVFLPVLFSLGALYIVLKEFFGPDSKSSDDESPPEE